MTTLRRLTLGMLAALALGGCGAFDSDRGSRRERQREREQDRRDEQRAERCEVQLDHYKERVRAFKKRGYKKKDAFREAKDELLRELERVDTPACRRELGNEIADLIADVSDERY